jgi:stage V sporulation protein B
MLPKKMISGSAVFFTRQFVTYLVAFIVQIIVARTFTPDLFGVITVSTALMGLINLIPELGLGQAVVRFVSEYNARGERDRVKAILFSSIKIRLFTCFPTGIILFFLAQPIANDILHFSAIPQAVTVLQFFALGILIPTSIYSLIGFAFLGYQQFSRSAAIGLMGSVLESLLKLGLVLLGFGIVGYAIGNLVAGTITCIISFIFFYFLIWKTLDDVEVKRDSTVYRKIISYGVPLALSGIFIAIYFNIIPFFIGILRPVEEAGYYGIAYGFMFAVTMLLNSLYSPILPIVTEVYAKDIKQFERIYVESMKYILVFTFPIVFLMFSLADPIIRIFYSSKYIAAVLALQILAFWIIARMTSSFIYIILQTLQKTVTIAKISLAITVLSTFLAFFLTFYFGFVGAALAFTGANYFGLGLYVMVAKTSLHVKNPLKYAVKPLISSIIMTIMIFLLSKIGLSAVFFFITAIVLGVLVYGVSIVLIGGINKYDIDKFRQATPKNKLIEAIIVFFLNIIEWIFKIQQSFEKFLKSSR